MERQGEEVHVEVDEARGGSTPHVTRWVLGLSLLLAVVALSLVWIIPAMTANRDAAEPTVGAEIQEAQDDSDAVLGEDFTPEGNEDETTIDGMMVEDDQAPETGSDQL